MHKITSRIKLISLMLSLILVTLIFVTIYLNEQTKHDSYVVNIAGKERMLSQKMAKELFLNAWRYESDFKEFQGARDEFVTNLTALKNGNSYAMITPPPSDKIKTQLIKITQTSEKFMQKSELIKAKIIKGETISQNDITLIYEINNQLLIMIDETVKDYTNLSGEKKKFLERVQYFFGFLTFLVIATSFYFTRRIENEFDRFLSSANEVSKIKCEEDDGDDEPDTQEMGSNELEVAEANMKQFLTKVEKVIQKAENALDESHNALSQIEGAAKIMEKHTSGMNMDEKNRRELEKYIDRSEDLTISSLDEIANTKKMLDKFQHTIDSIVKKMS